jgi:hypothetical protein
LVDLIFNVLFGYTDLYHLQLAPVKSDDVAFHPLLWQYLALTSGDVFDLGVNIFHPDHLLTIGCADTCDLEPRAVLAARYLSPGKQ